MSSLAEDIAPLIRRDIEVAELTRLQAQIAPTAITKEDRARWLTQAPDLLGRFEALEGRFWTLAKLFRFALSRLGIDQGSISRSHLYLQMGWKLTDTPGAEPTAVERGR